MYPAGIKVDGKNTSIQISPSNWREIFCKGLHFQKFSYQGDLSNLSIELPQQEIVNTKVQEKGPKIIEKSTSKLPNSSPKPSQIHPKTDQNPPQKALKMKSAKDCASDRFCASFFLLSGRLLGAFARLLGPSWSCFGASGGVLETSWDDLGAILGRPWGVLEHLGCVLRASLGILEAFRDKSHEKP